MSTLIYWQAFWKMGCGTSDSVGAHEQNRTIRQSKALTKPPLYTHGSAITQVPPLSSSISLWQCVVYCNVSILNRSNNWTGPAQTSGPLEWKGMLSYGRRCGRLPMLCSLMTCRSLMQFWRYGFSVYIKFNNRVFEWKCYAVFIISSFPTNIT